MFFMGWKGGIVEPGRSSPVRLLETSSSYSRMRGGGIRTIGTGNGGWMSVKQAGF